MSTHHEQEGEFCPPAPSTEVPLTPRAEPPVPVPTPTPAPIPTKEIKYDSLTKFYPPSPAEIAAATRLFIIEHETGEGFLDFIYCNFDASDLNLIIEIDGREWCRLTPNNINSAATGLAIDGWYGWFGSQHYSDEDDAYGIVIVPVKDCLPYYETLRIWVENVGEASQTLKRAFIAWRRRK